MSSALIFGMPAIAKALGCETNQGYYLASRGLLPIFKVVGRWCLRPAAYEKHCAERERAALAEGGTMRATPNKRNRPPDKPGAASTCGLAGTQYDELDNSTGSDLLQEFTAMAARACEAAFDWLAKRICIPRAVLYRAGPAIIGVARVETDSSYWQPVPTGKPAIVVPCSYGIDFGDLDSMIDLIAWTPAKPDCWYWRTGFAGALGEAEIERAWLTEKPLLLHATPQDWVRAGGEGACILNWRCPPMTIRNVETFDCPNGRYAARLERLLAEPTRRRKILYPGECHAA